MRTFFSVDQLELTDHRLFLIAGPCVIESEESARAIAAELKAMTTAAGMPFLFKASFDKANRTSGSSYRGCGLERGLAILDGIHRDFAVPVVSDIHEPWQAAPAAEVLSVLQIPAFLCRQTDLLVAAARTGKPVNIKKGQFVAPEDMALALRKMTAEGNERVMLTERGTFFGYGNLVVDMRSIPVMARTGRPVVIDATHSVQRPSAAGGVSGGNPEFIPTIAAAAIAAGANGVFLETHPEPGKALSDGANAIPLNALPPLLSRLQKVYNSLL